MYPARKVVAALCSLWVALAAANASTKPIPDRDTPVPADQPIPAVDFARPYLFREPVLNPSGTHFAAPTKNKRLENNLLFCEIATGKTKWSSAGVHWFAWIDDAHVLLNGQDNGVLEIKNPTNQQLVSTVLPMGERGLRRDSGFLWSWPLDYGLLPRSSGWIVRVWHRREDGRPAYYQTIQSDSRRHLFWSDNGRWVECPVNLDDITPVALGATPREMIVVGPPAKGLPRALQRLDTATGQLGEVIYRDPQYDCLPLIRYKPTTMEVSGVSVPARTDRMVWLAPRLQEAQDLVNRQFPGAVASIVSTDLQQNKMVIETVTDRQPPIFYVLDFEKKSLGLIKRVVPWLDPARMARMQVLSYHARDGVAIEGYLTLPAGTTKERPAPLVVMIHGGPWQVRYEGSFDGDAQFLASRGYAVLQVNYRGSAGYDSRIDPADRFDFQKMSDDVTDGVHALDKSGLIDPRRVALYGSGFGAYLAMCSAADEPELYRCAILFGGIYDWAKLFGQKDSRTTFNDAWLQRRLHEFNRTPPSPLARKDRINLPLFLTRNVRVSDVTEDTQIFDFYSAMKSRVSCEFFGDLNIRTEQEANSEEGERLERIEAFLARHMAQK